MAAVSVPPGIFWHAVSNVPHLIEKTPAPPSPLPIPYPNNAHLASGDPSHLVLNALFDHVEVIEAVQQSDFFVV